LFHAALKQSVGTAGLIPQVEPQEAALNDFYVLVMALPLVVIMGGLIIGAMALHHNARLKELAYRERIAMIERGLAPSPEADPEPFERTVGRASSLSGAGIYESSPSARYRSGGILLMAIGLGVFFIISLAGEAMAAGVGVGGAIMVVGAALLLNAYLARNDRPTPVLPPRERPTPREQP
jgi:hypothetical protein